MSVDCLIMLLYLRNEFINTKQLKMKTLGKIRLIEEPKSEDLLRNELEEALGGWNCTSYDDGWWSDHCKKYNSGTCSDGSGADNYCQDFTS